MMRRKSAGRPELETAEDDLEQVQKQYELLVSLFQVFYINTLAISINL